ncbi:MAG: hypothetical protein ACYCOU_18465 [Sulfobacillus sp.]
MDNCFTSTGGDFSGRELFPGLSGLAEGQSYGAGYQEHVKFQMHSTGAAASRKQVGTGRVAYIPVVEFDGVLPPPEPYFAITDIFWKRPKNWKAITDAVHWGAGDRIPLTLDGPEFLVANCTYQTREQRFLVHLVNYNVIKVPSLIDLRIRVALPENKKAQKVTLHAPDVSDARPLDFTNDSSGTRFTVPEVKAYALIALQVRSEK